MFMLEQSVVCEGIRAIPPLFTPSQMTTTRFHWPGYSSSNIGPNICEFPCFTLGKVLSPFHSEIGKMRRRFIFPFSFSPFFFASPSGILGMLIWSSRCTELMGPHQKHSVKAYPLPVNCCLLSFSILLSPLTSSLLGQETGTPIS